MRDGLKAMQGLYEGLFKYPIGDAPLPPTPALEMSEAVVKSFETTGLKKCPPLFEGEEPYWKCYTGKSRTLSKKRTSSTTKTVEEVIAPKRLETMDVSMASTLLPIDVRSGGDSG
jgi:hypothetical protein